MTELSDTQRRKSRVRKGRIAKVRSVAQGYGYGDDMTLPTVFVDLLTDFFHLCDEEKVNFEPEKLLKVALELYRLECAELKPSTEPVTRPSSD